MNIGFDANNEKMTARIMLIGKTGTGKSSFINYFLDLDEETGAKVGNGVPCTQSLNKYEIEKENMKLEVYDTKGVEVEDYEEIIEDLKKEIKRRNSSDEIKDWFHTIFYVFSYANARLEEEEIKLLKSLKKEISQTIHIVITNSDCATEEQRKNYKDKLLKELKDEISIFSVCSIETKKRNGKETKKEGKEEINKKIFKVLWDDISNRLSTKYSKDIKEKLKSIVIREFDKEIEKEYNPDTILKMQTRILEIIEKEKSNYEQEYELKIKKEINKMKEFFEVYSNTVNSNEELKFSINLDTRDYEVFFDIFFQTTSKISNVIGRLLFDRTGIKKAKEEWLDKIDNDKSYEIELRKYITKLL